jgi:signal peptidase II
MIAWNRIRLVAGTTVAAFAVDQVAKRLMIDFVFADTRSVAVAPFFNLTLGFNFGVSFGMFDETFFDAVWVLVAINATILVLVAGFAYKTGDGIEAFAFALVLGGGLANLVDRVRIGAVIDFLDLHYAGWHWPTFNTADIAIVGGCVIVGFRAFFARRLEPSKHRGQP